MKRISVEKKGKFKKQKKKEKIKKSQVVDPLAHSWPIFLGFCDIV
jgi:hypothetical protein